MHHDILHDIHTKCSEQASKLVGLGGVGDGDSKMQALAAEYNEMRYANSILAKISPSADECYRVYKRQRVEPTMRDPSC